MFVLISCDVCMQLVEQHRIDQYDPRFAAIDAAAFASKNLYNVTLYHTRQVYILDGERIGYAALARLMQPTAPYRALPAKVAQWVLKQVATAWDSCRTANMLIRRTTDLTPASLCVTLLLHILIITEAQQ